jgi:hypothetical protein
VGQISCERFSDILGQRHRLRATALAANGKLATLPMEVVQRQSAHLLCAQAQAGKQQQDGMIPATASRVAPTAPEHAIDLSGRERLRQRREPPTRDPRHALAEIALGVTAEAQVPQERPQPRAELSHVNRRAVDGAPLHEREYVRGVPLPHRSRIVRRARDHEGLRRLGVVLDRSLCQSAFGEQILLILVQQALVHASSIESQGSTDAGLPKNGEQLAQSRPRAASSWRRSLVEIAIDHCLGNITDSKPLRLEPSAEGTERYVYGCGTWRPLQNAGSIDQIQSCHTPSPVSYEPTGENTKLCRMR